MTRSPLALAWGSRSPHSEASCFLFFSRLESQLRIAPHSCHCVHILFTCCFLLYMHETLYLYVLQGKQKYFKKGTEQQFYSLSSLQKGTPRRNSTPELSVTGTVGAQAPSLSEAPNRDSYSELGNWWQCLGCTIPAQNLTSVPVLNLKKTRRL